MLPVIAPYEFLIGTWEGPGHGHYPTIDDFHYRESVTFTAIPGKPFLRYEQRTASAQGQPMHTEVGYLRPGANGHLELVLAQPMGQTELLEGTTTFHDDGTVTMALNHSQVRYTSTARVVDATARRYAFNTTKTAVHTEFDMAAVGEPLQLHLVSELHKVS